MYSYICLIPRSILNRLLDLKITFIKRIFKKRNIPFFVLEIKWRNVTIGFLILPIKDIGIANELLIGGIREPRYVKHLLKFINIFKHRISTVLDIGANYGYFSLIMNYGLDNKKIYALEPVSETFQILQNNIWFNKTFGIIKNKFILENIALTSSPYKKVMYIPPQSNWASLNKHPYAEITRMEEVNNITMQKFIESKNIPLKGLLLRMDLEGFEYELIKNNTLLLGQMKDLFLSLEVHPHILGRDKFSELLDILEELKLKIYSVSIDFSFKYMGYQNRLIHIIHNNLNNCLNKHCMKELRLLNKLKSFHSLKNSKCLTKRAFHLQLYRIS